MSQLIAGTGARGAAISQVGGFSLAGEPCQPFGVTIPYVEAIVSDAGDPKEAKAPTDHVSNKYEPNYVSMAASPRSDATPASQSRFG